MTIRDLESIVDKAYPYPIENKIYTKEEIFDLIVDRAKLFETLLKEHKLWIIY